MRCPFFFLGKESIIWRFPKLVGFPNNHGVCLLKWSFGGVWGISPFKETPIYIYTRDDEQFSIHQSRKFPAFHRPLLRVSCHIVWPTSSCEKNNCMNSWGSYIIYRCSTKDTFHVKPHRISPQKKNTRKLGGWNFTYFFLFSPLKLGKNVPILTFACFSNGLVASTTNSFRKPTGSPWDLAVVGTTGCSRTPESRPSIICSFQTWCFDKMPCF